MNIINPNIEEEGEFTQMWITSLLLVIPNSDRPLGSIVFTLSPFDGERILATSIKKDVKNLVSLMESDVEFLASIKLLKDEVQSMSGTESPMIHLAGHSIDPTKPVVIVATFRDKTTFMIKDAFGLASSNQGFGITLQTIMAELARQAGLEVS